MIFGIGWENFTICFSKNIFFCQRFRIHHTCFFDHLIFIEMLVAFVKTDYEFRSLKRIDFNFSKVKFHKLTAQMQSNSRTIFPVIRTFEISFENVTDFFFRNSDAVIFKSDYRLITFFQNRDFNFSVVRREFESIRQEVEVHFVHQVSVDI